MGSGCAQFLLAAAGIEQPLRDNPVGRPLLGSVCYAGDRIDMARFCHRPPVGGTARLDRSSPPDAPRRRSTGRSFDRCERPLFDAVAPGSLGGGIPAAGDSIGGSPRCRGLGRSSLAFHLATPILARDLGPRSGCGRGVSGPSIRSVWQDCGRATD